MIDGGVFLGKDPAIEYGYDLAGTLARLDAFGAARALAADFSAVYYQSAFGNARTLELCAASNGRLIPLAAACLAGWSVSRAELEELRAAGFKAVGLFPHMQSWRWSDYGVAKFAEKAAEAGLPIQTGAMDVTDLGHIARAAGPTGARVLVRWMQGRGYNNLPEIAAVAEDFPEFLFDVGCVTQTGGIRWLCERVGSKRLYMASNSPTCLEGATYFSLYTADLDDADRANIEGASLAAALGVQAPPRRASAHPFWTAHRRAPKIDTHWHTGAWNIIEPAISHAAIRAELDAYGIEKMVTSSILALNHDLAAGNADTERLVAADKRVYGLIVVNPWRPAQSIAEIERLAANPRFVAVKTIQDFYYADGPMRIDHPAYRPILEAARRFDLPVMCHLPGLENVADAFPEIHFVAAHSTWRYRELAKRPNIYFDIATSSALRRNCDLRDLVAHAGPDRVIFSTDSQLMNPAWTLGKMASADLDTALLDGIFRRNALRAFPRLSN
ncbi:MAG: amidohydrolase family protein [Alphaproteobacteria bacterium]|nr:amidohydrolase family protein [Alphaproteobacteria bacterium]